MEKITKFDFAATFKALDEIEAPKATSTKSLTSLKEAIKTAPVAEALVEDYYEVSDKKDLEAAKADREEEIAKAKLAKIEKIVDLDADSPEDIQPSYIGKTIIQCPQCMTMFYKDQADIVISDEDPAIVNVGEACQHCGNTSGYSVIGKVAEVEPEPEKVEESGELEIEEKPEESREENELDLNFEDSKVETIPESEEEEVDLTPVEAEEKKEELLTSKIANALLEDIVEEEKPAELEEAIADNIVNEIKKNAKFEKITASTIKKLLKAMAKDSIDSKKVKNITAEDFIEGFGDSYAEIIFLFGDALSDLEIRKLGILDPKFIEACKKVESFNIEHQDPEYPISDADIVELAVDDGSADALKEIESEYKKLYEEVEIAEAESGAVDIPTEEAVEIIADVAKDIKAVAETTEEQSDAIDEIVDEKIEELCPECLEESGTIESGVEESLCEADEKSSVEQELEKFIKTLDEACEVKKALTEEELPAVTDANVDKMLNSEEFKEPVSEAEVENIIAQETNESLEEDINQAELAKKLKEHDEYIKVLQDEIKAEEEAIRTAKNEFIKKMHEKNLESLKAALDAAIPAEVKAEAAINDLPTPEEAGVEEPTKNEALKEEKCPVCGDELAGKEPCEDCKKKLAEIDEIKDEDLVECISKSLTDVYENVESFSLTNCELVGEKLIVEGKINFKSGLSKGTKYIFTEANSTADVLKLTGINEDLGADSKFIVTGKVEKSTLITESLSYKYCINESLVEGLAEKK